MNKPEISLNERGNVIVKNGVDLPPDETKRVIADIFNQLEKAGKTGQEAAEIALNSLKTDKEKIRAAILQAISDYLKALEEQDEEKEREKGAELVKLWTSNPKVLTMATDKVTGRLFGDVAGQNAGYDMKDIIRTPIFETGKGSDKKEIGVTMQILLTPEETTAGVKITKTLDAYQRAVQDALYTIIDHDLKKGLHPNEIIFDENRIFQVLRGKRIGRNKNNTKALQDITETLEIFQSMSISIDWEELKAAKKINTNISPKAIKQRYLTLNEIVGLRDNSGNVGNYYQLVQIPPYYSYLRACKQLITVDNSYFNINGMKSTKDAIKISNYLIRRIEQAKSEKNHMKSTIRLDTLFKETQIDASNKTTAKRKREMIFDMLDQLGPAPNGAKKEQQETYKNYIKGYKAIKGNRGQYEKIEIII